MAGSCAGIVLAAGSSRRMGRPKQLPPLRGGPLLESVVSAACRARFDDVVVVVGANHALIRRQVRWGRARVVVNPDHASGMSSSLSAGLAALDAGVERAMVILGDQPGVGSELFDRLLEVHSRSGRPAAALPPIRYGQDIGAGCAGCLGEGTSRRRGCQGRRPRRRERGRPCRHGCRRRAEGRCRSRRPGCRRRRRGDGYPRRGPGRRWRGTSLQPTVTAL